MRQRQQLSEEATEHRRQLLALAAEVKDWNDRIERPAAGAMDLAGGRSTSIWTDGEGGSLTDLAPSAAGSMRWTSALRGQTTTKKPSSSIRTGLFGSEQELEELRRQAGLN